MGRGGLGSVGGSGFGACRGFSGVFGVREALFCAPTQASVQLHAHRKVKHHSSQKSNPLI